MFKTNGFDGNRIRLARFLVKTRLNHRDCNLLYIGDYGIKNEKRELR